MGGGLCRPRLSLLLDCQALMHRSRGEARRGKVEGAKREEPGARLQMAHGSGFLMLMRPLQAVVVQGFRGLLNRRSPRRRSRSRIKNCVLSKQIFNQPWFKCQDKLCLNQIKQITTKQTTQTNQDPAAEDTDDKKEDKKEDKEDKEDKKEDKGEEKSGPEFS